MTDRAGWFKAPRGIIGSATWKRPFDFQLWFLISGMVNHADVTRNDFTYEAGTWSTCLSRIQELLPQEKRKPQEEKKPLSISAVRRGLERLAEAGHIKTEPLKLTDPRTGKTTYLGTKITLLKSMTCADEKTKTDRPIETKADKITRQRLGYERGASLDSEGRGKAPGSGSFSGSLSEDRGSGHGDTSPARPTVCPPNLDPVEEDALAARYDLPLEAIRWLATDWRFALDILRCGEPLDEPLRVAIINMAAQAAQTEQRRLAMN